MEKENKIKIFSKNGISQILVKSVKGQMISDREAYAVERQEMKGLLAVKVCRKGNAFRLTYDITGLIPLNNFLLTPMSRADFIIMLQNIFDVLEEIQKVHFNRNALNMDLDKVMVNPVKKKLLFLYLPIQGYNGNHSLRSFLREIIRAGSFEEEDSEYVQEYIRILNEGINFSVFELEEYIHKLLSEEKEAGGISCPRCGIQIRKDAKFCHMCGAKIIEEDERKGKVYVPINRHLNDDMDGGTTVFGGPQKKHPYLLRESTLEKIIIDKEEFLIGRSKQDCDYVIFNNKNIGRRHARIIRSRGIYYIEDMQSVNKTYVEEIPIVKEKLTDGTKIRLANEKFIFNLDS